jgi:outer membrane protein OmpA-like peptidoglycan-associated protein
MTSLFFVMLVLFILVYAGTAETVPKKELEAVKKELEATKKKGNATEKELERIKEVGKTVNNIDANYFRYDSINKKHTLNMPFLFPAGVYDISKIIPDKRKDLINAGKAIKELITKYPERDNIKYLIIVEGQASKDGDEGNNDLSYHRAQSLVAFWKEQDIGLDKLKNCEIIIAGSGEEGVPRDKPDIPPANQRFLITIIPKIGELKK